MRTKFSGILTLILAFTVQLTFAQQKTISGTVTDDTGLPLPGVNIVIKGTATGTQSDFDGNYSISAQTGQTLVFSYVGFEPQEVSVTPTTGTVNMQLQSGSLLDEVVITTYGRLTQRDLTTNISRPDMETVRNVTASNVGHALQGTASGVQVGATSGAPGGEVSIRIRGASTISGSSNPLFVVDGVPLFTDVTMSNSFGNQQNSALSNLNMDDIESIEILKDGAATSMYGQRGSNGVVVITTKKGERGDFRVNFNSTVGFQNPLNKYETMNYGQWLNYRDTFAENSGAPSGSFSANDTGNPDLSGASQEVLQAFYLSQANVGDNYLSKLYVDDAITHNNNFNISGGNDKTRLYLGASHFYQEGTVLTQDFDRKSVRLNVTQQINDRIDFTGGISITDEFINQISGDNNIFGVLSTGLLERPGLTLLDENGEFTPYQQFTFSNPLQNVVEDLGKAKTFRTLANSLLTIHITDNLSAETVFGLDQSEFRQRIYFPSTSARGNFGVTNGYGREDHASRRIYQVRQSFNYDKSLSDDIRFRMYVGGEYETRSSSLLTADAEDFPNPDLQYLSAATTPLNTLSSYSEERRVSGISRMGFTFWNKLVLEGSLRADASSKFNKEDRIGYFPGASFAYTLSEENFMQNTFIDYFRLRASWGVTGNDSPFGRYTSPGVSTAQYADQGAIFLTLGDGQARWEETETIDVGFSTKFLNNRFDLSYAYYIKETKDNSLVIPFITSPGQGARQTNLNLASMRNFGHEIDLTVLIADTDNFSWSTNFNLGTLDNKVTFLPKNEFGDTEPINAGFANRVDEGFPLGFFYVLEADGLYQSMDEVPAELQALGVGPGDVRYVDQNGDGIINDDDFVFGGSPWADFTLNWSSQVRYKNFDFSFLWAWSEGGKMFNNNLAFSGISGGPNFNKFANQLNWWTPTNTNTDIPRPNQQTQAYNNQDSTRFIEDASYIKLRNITLGYTLPNIKGVHSARVYVSADNLVLITDYSGVDPEVNTFGNTNISRGTDFLTQGGNKVWKFGMNLSF